MRRLFLITLAICFAGTSAFAGTRQRSDAWAMNGSIWAQHSSQIGGKKNSSSSQWSNWGSLKNNTDKPKNKKGAAHVKGGGKPYIAPVKPPVVTFRSGYGKGTIVIDTAGRKLYYVLSSTKAYRYPVAVGKKGFTWSGTKRISKKVNWPGWRPPAEMRKRKPGLPKYMAGGVNNPLGAKALYLGSTLYRIHGTNNSKSVGQAVSSGCFRMLNGHVAHLATIAPVGTKVRVLKRLPKKIVVSSN